MASSCRSPACLTPIMKTVSASQELIPLWTAFVAAAFHRPASRLTLAASRLSLAFVR
jgi:hypothetical protein